MNTSESPAQQNANPAIWNTVLRYGAYCGGTLAAFSLLTYLLDVNLMSLSGIIILYATMFAIGFVYAAMATRYQRDRLDGGYIGYGKALLVCLLTVLIGILISGLWNFVLVNFIDPDIVGKMKEQFLETWGESMSEEAREKALEGFDKAGNLGSTLLSSLSTGVFVSLIVGLITAAFMKKQPEISVR